MRRFTVPGTLAFVSMVAAGCDRTPPTDPRSSLALRMGADQAPAPKNFVAHLTGANEVPAHETRGVGQIKLQLSDEDRKSTRLNSSHTVISYAVFCLKKKKPNNRNKLDYSRC